MFKVKNKKYKDFKTLLYKSSIMNRNFFFISIFSLFISGIILLLSILISIYYHKLNPFFYDPGHYLFENINLFNKINNQSFLSLFKETFLFTSSVPRQTMKYWALKLNLFVIFRLPFLFEFKKI